MRYHSELHYQIANTSPREVWGGFSETEDGFAARKTMTWICDDCGKRFGPEQASSSYEATRCIPRHKAHVASVYADYEADALAAWNQALDERAFDQAESARLEVLAAQREAAYDVATEPF